MNDLLRINALSVVFSAGRGESKSGEVTAIDKIDLTLGSGRSLAVVGESGCGKSTLARVICGMQVPTSGELWLRDAPASTRALRSTFQMIFQDPFSSLNPRLPIWIQVSEPLRGLKQITAREALYEKANALIRSVGLEEADLGKYPHQFSGGQRQRIALARAMAIDPQVIVADEPLSSLDVGSQEEILELMLSIKESGRSFLLISHDFSHVHALADDVAVMKKGRINERGGAKSVLENPGSSYTKALIDAIPRIEL